MPSGILESESGMPNLNKYQSADEKINAIQSYFFLLIEQLRWSLRNLGADNFNPVDLQKITEPIYAKIKDAEGTLTELIVGEGGIAARVTNVEGSVSTVQQTATGLQSTVSDLNGKYTSLKQTVDGFDFDGFVTFNDLSRSGATTINGDNITTGTLQADYIDLDGALGVYDGRTFGGYLGFISGRDSSGYSTDGIGFMYSAARGQVYATSAGARIGYGSDSGVTTTSTGVYVRGGTFQYEGEIVSTSDRDKKQDISYDTEEYDALFNKLKPASFKFKSGTSGRTHTGLIAQDVRQAIQDAGLSTQDFAAYVEYQDEDANDSCGLRYGEFIGLLIDQVQRLKKRVDELEQKGGGTDAT